MGRKYLLSLGAVVTLVVTLLGLYTLRSALFPFALGLTLGYVMLPSITWLEDRLPRRGRGLAAKRIIVVTAIFAAGITLFTALTFYIGTAVIRSLNELVAKAPEHTVEAITRALAEPLRNAVSADFRPAVDSLLTSLGNSMGGAVQGVFAKGGAQIQNTLGFMLSFFSMPIFLFYILKDWNRLSARFDRVLPPNLAVHARNILGVVGHVMGRWLRAQLILGGVVGSLVFIGLMLLRVPNAIVLAIVAAATEMVPTIGPFIGGITAVIITLAFAPEKALGVALVFVIVQLLENLFLVPRVQGGQLDVHPALAMVLLVVGTYLAGFWGLVLAVPLTATITKVYQYLHNGGAGNEPSIWARLQASLTHEV